MFIIYIIIFFTNSFRSKMICTPVDIDKNYKYDNSPINSYNSTKFYKANNLSKKQNKSSISINEKRNQDYIDKLPNEKNKQNFEEKEEIRNSNNDFAKKLTSFIDNTSANIEINEKCLQNESSNIKTLTKIKNSLYFFSRDLKDNNSHEGYVGFYYTIQILLKNVLKSIKKSNDKLKNITDGYDISYKLDLSVEELNELIPELNELKSKKKSKYNKLIIDYIFNNLKKKDIYEYYNNWVLINLLFYIKF